jgi:RNA polymerase sigma factor (sigma-70 family)
MTFPVAHLELWNSLRFCDNMANRSSPEPTRKSDWVLTQNAFRQFLDWIDDGTDSGGQRYLEIRRRLVLYFDRKNCLSPDELADETLNRVARRLEEEGAIASDSPAHYCYIVARFVFLESLRGQRRQESLDDRFPAIPDSSEETQEAEQRSNCLDRCMQKLNTEERVLIKNYYQGEQRAKIEKRKALAAKLGVTINALTIRACRIRDKLEVCMRKCLRLPNERF